MNLKLIQLFEDLKKSGLQFPYLITPIPRIEGVYLGIDSTNKPCFFVKTIDQYNSTELVTSHVSICNNKTYKLTMPSGEELHENFQSILCDSNNSQDISTFLILLESYLSQNFSSESIKPTLLSFFRSLVRLFSICRSGDCYNDQQGLWGELFVMKEIRGFNFWTPFWHKENRNVFDFTSKKSAFELKTTSRNNRVHHFSHNQVFSENNIEIVIGSLILKPDINGLSLQSLIIACREQIIHTPYCMILENEVRRTDMQDLYVEGPKFNEQFARENLKLFFAKNVPHFIFPEPLGVSQTKYCIDLTNSPFLSTEEVSNWIESWNVEVRGF